MKDYELSGSVLQAGFYGSDILSLNSAFLFTLCQDFSVWWCGDGCLTRPKPCSAASTGERHGHRSSRKTGWPLFWPPHPLSHLQCWWVSAGQDMPTSPVLILTSCHSHHKFIEAFPGLGYFKKTCILLKT